VGIVLLQLSVESGFANFEEARRHEFVALDLFDGGQNRMPFHLCHGYDPAVGVDPAEITGPGGLKI
jgi:hypothetical protein